MELRNIGGCCFDALEARLKEAKDKITSLESDARYGKLSRHKIMVLQSRAEKAEAELSEIKRQIADGELVRADIAVQWATEVPFGTKTLGQFAKERAKE